VESIVIVTVTTTTVTTVAALGLGPALGGLAVLALLLFLVQRELATAAGPGLGPLARNLELAVAPLLAVFVAIVTSRLAELLLKS
jgi:hypothetical protein